MSIYPSVLSVFTSTEIPDSLCKVEVHSEYQEYVKVFSKTKAKGLPCHQPYDCIIDLMPGTILLRNHIYLLTENHRKPSYVEVHQINPNTAGYFLWRKRGVY